MIGNSTKRATAVDNGERIKLKNKIEREQAVINHVKSTYKFATRPTRITAANVFKDSFRINVYAEGPAGDFGLVKSPMIIHSELLCIDTTALPKKVADEENKE